MVRRRFGLLSEVVLLAGQIGSGKTSVAEWLRQNAAARLILVRQVLVDILGNPQVDRAELQREGLLLDTRSKGRWLLESVEEQTEVGGRWIVDAARTRLQIEPILKTLSQASLVYLEASEESRRRRFTLGQVTDEVKRSTSFDDAMRHATETEASALRSMADLVIETDGLDIAEVGMLVCEAMKWSVRDSA